MALGLERRYKSSNYGSHTHLVVLGEVTVQDVQYLGVLFSPYIHNTLKNAFSH